MDCNLEQFASDNNSGICPEALEYMIKANLGSVPAYGNDEWTSLATDYFSLKRSPNITLQNHKSKI